MKRQALLLFLPISLLFMPVGAAAQLTTLRIGFNGFHGAAPLYLGQEAGIFKKHGVTLEMIFFAGGSLSLQALMGKSLDLLMTGGPPFINAYLRGAKIKIIGGVTNLLPYVFVASSGISTSEQLRGKKIGISRFGSNTDFVVKLALSQFGLAPNEVSIMQVGGSQARLAALKSGTIHATVLSPEEAFVAQKMGLNPLLDFIEKGKTRRGEAVKQVMSLSRLEDLQIAERAYNGYMRSLPDDGRPTLKGLKLVLDDAAKENPRAKGLTVGQLLDLRFLP